MHARAAGPIRNAVAVAAAALLLAVATGQAAEGGQPGSSCVACHTDAEKLKAEAAKVPAPAGSALQSGKG